MRARQRAQARRQKLAEAGHTSPQAQAERLLTAVEEMARLAL